MCLLFCDKSGNKRRHHSETFVLGYAWVILPAVFHLLLSSWGFNPTDDGFVLAFARRIAEGQVPHRDFITLRPAGSALLHLPEIYWGGDYIIWWSRAIVWWQWSVMAWCWLRLLRIQTGVRWSVSEQILLTTVGTVLTAHSFPLIAWTTTDGCLLLTVGWYLLLPATRSRITRLLGYVIIGAAVLCKQSFLPALLVTLLLTGHWRHSSYWLAALFPLAAYAAWLWLSDALPDAWLQFSTRTQLLRAAARAAWVPMWWYPILGLVWRAWYKWLHQEHRYPLYYYYAGHAVWVAALFWWLIFLCLPDAHIYRLNVLPLAVAGWLFITFIHRPATWPMVRLGLLAGTLGWTASLSLGWNTTAFGAGALWIVAAALLRSQFPPANAQQWSIHRRAAWILTFCVAILFTYQRTQRVYRDQPVQHLSYHVGDQMQGFKGIYTNANTYQALAELRTLFDRYPLHRIAILTDFCAWWVAEPRLNPIGADITQSEELPSEHLIARIMTDLRTPPPPDSLLIITVRHYSWWLHTGWVPLQREERFRLIDSVQAQGALMDSTSNFYVWSLQHRRI